MDACWYCMVAFIVQRGESCVNLEQLGARQVEPQLVGEDGRVGLRSVAWDLYHLQARAGAYTPALFVFTRVPMPKFRVSEWHSLFGQIINVGRSLPETTIGVPLCGCSTHGLSNLAGARFCWDTA